MSSDKATKFQNFRIIAVLGQKAECAVAEVIAGWLQPQVSAALEVQLAIELVPRPSLAAIALCRVVSFPHHDVSEAMKREVPRGRCETALISKKIDFRPQY